MKKERNIEMSIKDVFLIIVAILGMLIGFAIAISIVIFIFLKDYHF